MTNSIQQSNSNIPTQSTLEMRVKLEKEAKGRGGYRWNEQDLFNALQWFSTTMDNTSNSATESHQSRHDSCTSEKQNIKSFLESLLRNPGILFHRTLVGHKRKRSSGVGAMSTAASGSGSSSDGSIVEGTLLPFILAYCLSHCTHDGKEVVDDDDDDDDETYCGSSTLPQQVLSTDWLASILTDKQVLSTDWLVSILTDIAMERRLTEVLYNKYSRVLKSSTTSSNKTTSVVEQMLDYFSQPGMIVQSVYAAKLYMCYLRLLENDGKHTNRSKEDPDSLNAIEEEGAAITFLQKLQSLAEIHQDVAQVLFLMALEPIKRCTIPRCDDLGWIQYAISTCKDEILIHAIGLEPELEMAFHPIFVAIINTIQNCEVKVYNLSPCFICMLAKVHTPFAKALLSELIGHYVEHQKRMPTFIAKEAMKLCCSSEFESKDVVDDDPRLIVEKCRGIIQLWKMTSVKMNILLTDAIENERAKSVEQNDHLAVLTLDEISRRITVD